MGLIVATSTVADGNMSLKWGEEREVVKNREKFLGGIRLKLEDCVAMSLVHGTKVMRVGKDDRGKMVEVDGLVTSEPGVGLFMVTADCLPLVLFDKKRQVVGLAHLGWRGVHGKLAERMVKELLSLGCEVKNI